MSKKPSKIKSQQTKAFRPLFYGDTPQQHKTAVPKTDYRRKPKNNRWEDWSDE